MPAACDIAEARWGTSGISTSSLSPFRVGANIVWRAVDHRRRCPRHPRAAAPQSPGRSSVLSPPFEGAGLCVPTRLVTDKLRSYAAAHRRTMPSVRHSPIREQSRRSLAPGDATPRTTDAPLQVARTRPALLGNARNRSGGIDELVAAAGPVVTLAQQFHRRRHVEPDLLAQIETRRRLGRGWAGDQVRRRRAPARTRRRADLAIRSWTVSRGVVSET